MFGSETLEVAIGIIFIYILISLICTAIREGMDKSGRGLLIMPSDEYKRLSDQDVQAVVAYLRSQPSVQPDRHDQGADRRRLGA